MQFSFLFVYCYCLLFGFKLKWIKINNELCVLLSLLLNFRLCVFLILDRIYFKLHNWSFHVCKLLLKLFQCFRIFFMIILISRLTHHVVLIQFHNSCHIGFIIFRLYYFVHVLWKLNNSSFLGLCLYLLLSQFLGLVVDLGLQLAQLVSNSITLFQFTLKHLF